MKNRLLILILQNLVLFPNQEIKLEFSNDLSKKIIKKSLEKYNGEIIIASPKANKQGNLSIKDVQGIAAFAKIKNALTLPNGNLRVIIRGIKRIKIVRLQAISEDFVGVDGEIPEPPVYNLDEETAYTRKIKDLVKRYVEINSRASNSILSIIRDVSNLSKLTDMIAAYLEISAKQKSKLFKECNYYKRAHMLTSILNNEILSIELENKIDAEIRDRFDKSEKEIIIREKIKLLSEELGDVDNHKKECENFYKLIDNIKAPIRVKNSLRREAEAFERTLNTSPEFGSLRTHLEFVTSLPWNKSSRDVSDIKVVDEHLKELHYGLDKAKERIEEYIALKKENKDIASPILCLIGPPGVGKTTFARELAGSMNREFVKVSVGGLNDSSELIGHRRTYIGAAPGKIMEGIRKCGVDNPIILIDEIDKMVKDYKGDPASVLLDILDSNQNKEFVDNYVQEPFDLSNVIFILTANEESHIPRALYDRLEVIEVSSYTMFDKLEIAKNYTLPRLGKEYGYDYHKIKFTDEAIKKIALLYTKEAGVRELERKISSIIRKILLLKTDKTITIKDTDIEKYLSLDGSYGTFMNTYSGSGVVNVPAWTSQGGCVLNIEASIIDGPEKIMTSGSLGKVMQESCIVALSYLKKNAKLFKLDTKTLSNTLHVHALDGATPKDGPSAGIGIAIAITSEVLGKKVPNNVCFTGEITLKGRILKVGGIREKVISAYNSGIEKFYIPKENAEDLKKIPKKILKSITIIEVDQFTEVYKDIFE